MRVVESSPQARIVRLRNLARRYLSVLWTVTTSWGGGNELDLIEDAW